QAEDGIRDFHVTGVQTCALPILAAEQLAIREVWVGCDTFRRTLNFGLQEVQRVRVPVGELAALNIVGEIAKQACARNRSIEYSEIGRASCRERVWISVVRGDGEI